jgi:peptide/nickel transport system ATP-binding protein
MTTPVTSAVSPTHSNRDGSTMLEVRDLRVHFPIYKGFPISRQVGAVRAVDGINFSVKRGETVGLVGESGCGKSTLGRMLAGILTPSEGQVRLAGVPPMRGKHKITTRIQTVFQDPFASLNPRQRIGDAIAEGPLAHGLATRAQAPVMVAEWLARVGLDPVFAQRFPHQFSGGQRQRVAIARALVNDPSILLADEPTGNLDSKTGNEIMGVFERLHATGNTIVLVTHEADIAAYAHRTIHIRDGQVEKDVRRAA